MLVFLSPAKSLDYGSEIPALEPTSPRFESESAILADAAADLSAARLMAIMDISENLAVLNVERYANFANLPTRPAIYAFAGDVYVGFEAKTLDEPAIAFAQDHVRILSGLYGLLRPLDAIRPYRLEMGTRWAPSTGDLYGFWGQRIADLAMADLKAEGSNVIVNLASKEYWAAIGGKLDPAANVITIDFREEGPDGLRFNSFAAKRARGMMARFICEHRHQHPEALKGFDTDGYHFDAEGSDDTLWRFIRR
jgi:cytoplasmic iron level regulating protein YaaA (DUF328/UPF0246 family)